MNKENELKLVNKYPNLYQEYYLSERESCMGRGFEVADGWFNLIDELSAKIVEVDPHAVALQVKEKFGLLRIYITGNEAAWNLVHEYENKSSTICEECGTTENVSTEGRGWIVTLCKKCRAERIIFNKINNKIFEVITLVREQKEYCKEIDMLKNAEFLDSILVELVKIKTLLLNKL